MIPPLKIMCRSMMAAVKRLIQNLHYTLGTPQEGGRILLRDDDQVLRVTQGHIPAEIPFYAYHTDTTRH